MNINPATIRQLIANLLLAYPELFDDEEARALSVESETPAVDYLRVVEHRRREAETMAGALAGQIAQLELRQARFVHQEKACRQIMFGIMQEATLPRITLPEATLSISNGRPKIIITDESAIPDDYCEFKRRPNKAAIRTVLDAGAPVAGCTLSNAEPHLTIRTK